MFPLSLLSFSLLSAILLLLISSSQSLHPFNRRLDIKSQTFRYAQKSFQPIQRIHRVVVNDNSNHNHNGNSNIGITASSISFSSSFSSSSLQALPVGTIDSINDTAALDDLVANSPSFDGIVSMAYSSPLVLALPIIGGLLIASVIGFGIASWSQGRD